MSARIVKNGHKALEQEFIESLKEAAAPLTFEQVVRAVKSRVPREQFATDNSLVWYVKNAQVALEHNGRIERTEEPVKFKLPDSKKGSLRQLYHMKAKPQQVWKMLVDPKEIEGWSGSPAVMSAVSGSKFSLWEGSVQGENIEIISGKKLVQKWKEADWKEPSIVTFLLGRGKANDTVVELLQTNIPKDRLQDVAEGWDEYYLGAIKKTFEK